MVALTIYAHVRGMHKKIILQANGLPWWNPCSMPLQNHVDLISYFHSLLLLKSLIMDRKIIQNTGGATMQKRSEV